MIDIFRCPQGEADTEFDVRMTDKKSARSGAPEKRGAATPGSDGRESIESFLARGGVNDKLAPGEFGQSARTGRAGRAGAS